VNNRRAKNNPQIKLTTAILNNVHPKTGCVGISGWKKIRRQSLATLAPMSETATFPNPAQARTTSPKKPIGKANLENLVLISASQVFGQTAVWPKSGSRPVAFLCMPLQ
jgi:hypothetical protein